MNTSAKSRIRKIPKSRPEETCVTPAYTYSFLERMRFALSNARSQVCTLGGEDDDVNLAVLEELDWALAQFPPDETHYVEESRWWIRPFAVERRCDREEGEDPCDSSCVDGWHFVVGCATRRAAELEARCQPLDRCGIYRVREWGSV